MTRKTLALFTVLMVAAMLGVAFWLGAALPADARLPIHWGLDGRPDGFAGKWVALLVPPGVTAFVGLPFHFLPSLEPRREGLARSQGLYLWGWASILIVCALLELILVSTALGRGPAGRPAARRRRRRDVGDDRQPARQVAQHVPGRHPHPLDAGQRGSVDQDPPARR
jgi:hypothetical protein